MENRAAGVAPWGCPSSISPTGSGPSGAGEENLWGEEEFYLQMDENGVIGLPWDTSSELCDPRGSEPPSRSPAQLSPTPSVFDLENSLQEDWVNEDEEAEETRRSWLVRKQRAEGDAKLETSEDEGGEDDEDIEEYGDVLSPGLKDEPITEGSFDVNLQGRETSAKHTLETLSHSDGEDSFDTPAQAPPTFPHPLWGAESLGSYPVGPASSPRSPHPLCSPNEESETPLPASLTPEPAWDCSPRSVPEGRGPPGESLGSPLVPCQRPTPSPRKAWHSSPVPSSDTPHTVPKVWQSPSGSDPTPSSPTWDKRSPSSQKPSARSLCLDGSRKGQLSHPMPDFSKVEPRVRFPKTVYKPPKSKGSSQRRAPTAEPPLVFKSPADIVRDVLLSSSDGPPAGPRRPLTVTTPPDFCSPQQASTLVHQLQEDYNRLLTKYAEAENTIDRLRLEAKVSLYSDPPKPSHSVHSGSVSLGSKVMHLTFPQAQKAELGPNSAPLPPVQPHPEQDEEGLTGPSSASSRSLDTQLGEKLTEALALQADRFLLQLASFEDLLKNRKLKPFEQMKGLSTLAQGLDSLERSYLGARDEHRLLQQRGIRPGSFDPDRVVEGRVFQSGMHLEELRELAEETARDRPNSTAPPSPPTPASEALLTYRESSAPTPLPESPLSPVQRGSVNMEVSSVSEESEGEEEEGLPDALLHPLRLKHQHVECDFSHLLDHYQSFRELPQLLDLGQMEGVEADGRVGGHCGIDSVESERTPPQLSKGTTEMLLSGLQPRKAESSVQQPLHHVPGLPRQHGGDSKGAEGNPYSSSKGESAASERRPSKLLPRTGTVPPQDGVVSPETDSGFVGSESSRLTTAVRSSCQQRARVRLAGQSRGKGGEKSEPSLVQPLPDSTRLPQCVRDPPSLREVLRSGGGASEGKNPPSASPSDTGSPQCWARGVTSESEPESERTHSVSGGEKGRSVQYTQVTNQRPSQQWGRSPARPFSPQDSGLLTHRHKAIQSLEVEVSRLREQLERSLRQTNPPSPIRGSILSQEEPPYTPQPQSSTPCTRSTQYRKTGRRGEVGQEVEEPDRKEGPPRPAPRKRPASAPRRSLELDVTTDSERAKFPQKPNYSEHIPASSAAQRGRRSARADALSHKGPRTREERNVTASGSCDETDLREKRGSARRSECSQRDVKWAGGGTVMSSSTGPHSRLCSLCAGCGQLRRDTAQGLAGARDSELRDCRPMGAPYGGGKGVFLATPATPVLGTVPVVPCWPSSVPVLYYSSPSYPPPVYLSPMVNRASRTVVAGRQSGRSLSADNVALGRSLSRALDAALSMRAASRRIADGLRQQGALVTQSSSR